MTKSGSKVAGIVSLGLLVMVGLLAVATNTWVQIPFLKFTLAVGECKFGPPLAGVYIPGRLHLIDRCRTVSGIVDCLKLEPNGDYHVRLRLDVQFSGLRQPANALQRCPQHAGPHLVVEIIPQHPRGVLFRTNNADAGGFIDPRLPVVETTSVRQDPMSSTPTACTASFTRDGPRKTGLKFTRHGR